MIIRMVRIKTAESQVAQRGHMGGEKPFSVLADPPKIRTLLHHYPGPLVRGLRPDHPRIVIQVSVIKAGDQHSAAVSSCEVNHKRKPDRTQEVCSEGKQPFAGFGRACRETDEIVCLGKIKSAPRL